VARASGMEGRKRMSEGLLTQRSSPHRAMRHPRLTPPADLRRMLIKMRGVYGGGGGDSTSVQCLFSITPLGECSYSRAAEEELIQRRSSTYSQNPPWVSAHTAARRRRRRFNVGRVLVLNNFPGSVLIQPRGGRGGVDSTAVECLFSKPPLGECSYSRTEEKEEIQRRSSACSQ